MSSAEIEALMRPENAFLEIDPGTPLHEALRDTEVVRMVSLSGDAEGRPKETWKRGLCPLCGDDSISVGFAIKGKGLLVVWYCWGWVTSKTQCQWRKVL